MSLNAPRRYLFCEYETLAQLDFEQLDRICERLFILISAEVDTVPFALVRVLQQLGPSVRWVQVDQQPGVSLSHHLTFLLGRLHQKLPAEIQFAILSDDAVFDPLIQFINEKGRSALRVQREKVPDSDPTEAEKADFLPPEISPAERARQLWLENDLAPASAVSEKN